jgi:putative ABC transport system permease protein
LQQQYPDLEIRPVRKVSASEGQVLDKIKGLMGLVSIVILALSSLCVNTTLMAIVGERAREFALQKALGPATVILSGKFSLKPALSRWLQWFVGGS